MGSQHCIGKAWGGWGVGRGSKNGVIMVENITILADKNVNKQNFATKQFELNFNRL